jgi:hypothetical protein
LEKLDPVFTSSIRRLFAGGVLKQPSTAQELTR